MRADVRDDRKAMASSVGHTPKICTQREYEGRKNGEHDVATCMTLTRRQAHDFDRGSMHQSRNYVAVGNLEYWDTMMVERQMKSRGPASSY